MEKMLQKTLTSQSGLSPAGTVDFICLSNIASLKERREDGKQKVQGTLHLTAPAKLP